MRAGGDASEQIAALQQRAGVTVSDADNVGTTSISGHSVEGAQDQGSSGVVIDTDFLVAERARELMWEAHRRTDLIRFGLFDSDSYLWPYKGGDSYAGQSFQPYMCIFPIPPTELATNKALQQNPGY